MRKGICRNALAGSWCRSRGIYRVVPRICPRSMPWVEGTTWLDCTFGIRFSVAFGLRWRIMVIGNEQARVGKGEGGSMNRPRAADDFSAIRARMEELRRER